MKKTHNNGNMAILEPSVYQNPTLDKYRAAVEEAIENGRLKLPVLPEVVRHLLAMKDDAELETSELSRLIHRDVTLAGHVLKISNSVYYAGARQISSLSQAIVRLGRRALIKIAVSITMQGSLFQVAGYESELKAMATHALTSGAYAQHIGTILNIEDDELFMCGLMHEVGKPVLLQILVDLGRTWGETIPAPLLSILMEDLHTAVGSKLAELWRMPVAIRLACLYCKDYVAASESQQAIMITYLANRLATALCRNVAEKDQGLWSDPVFESLEFTPAQRERLYYARGEIEERVQTFTVDR